MTTETEQIPWPEPDGEMLNEPRFLAIWEVIKWWDIAVPGAYNGCCQATGNHVRAILDALQECERAAERTGNS